MKKRLDFVSNSSSSSFIVINDCGKYVDGTSIGEVPLQLHLPCENGCMEFSWQVEKYYDVFSKLNWAALVILSQMNIEKHETAMDKLKSAVNAPWRRAKDMEKMLKAVCKEHLGIDVQLRKADWRKDDNSVGYIDHQSNIVETPENARMFMSKKMLADFLFNDASYIRNSNDNCDNDEDLVYDKQLDDYVRIHPKDYAR